MAKPTKDDIKYIYPIPVGASKKQIIELTTKIASKKSFSVKDDIIDFVENIGGEIKVGTSGHGDKESGSIIASTEKDFTIYISSITSIKRDRFTIAHEIGHLFLHLPIIQRKFPSAIMRATRYIDKSDPQQLRAEWEANWFAAEFLMPTDLFKRTFAENSVEETADFFSVSVQAAEIRASSLGLSK